MEFCPKCGSVLFPDENNALNCSCSYLLIWIMTVNIILKKKYLKSQPI